MKKFRYVLLTTMPFLVFGFNSCTKQEHQHKNVITGIGTFNEHKIIMLNDIETGQERIYQFSDKKEPVFFDYLRLNDTVKIITSGVYSGDGYYKDNFILREDAVGIEYNDDSIYARMQRKQFDEYKQKISPASEIKQETR